MVKDVEDVEELTGKGDRVALKEAVRRVVAITRAEVINHLMKEMNMESRPAIKRAKTQTAETYEELMDRNMDGEMDINYVRDARDRTGYQRKDL